MTDPTPASIIQSAAEERDARLRRIADAWTAYHAELTPPLRKRTATNEAGQSITIDDNVNLGWIGDAVDLGVHWLFGDGVGLTVNLGEDDSTTEIAKTTNATAQDWLEDFLEESGGALLELELAVLGAITGHPMLRLNTLNTEPATPQAYRADPTLLELAVIDAADADAEWLPRNVHRATCWTLTFRVAPAAKDGPAGAGLERHIFEPDIPERPRKWSIRVERTDAQGRWVATTATTDWPYPWPPIFAAQNLPAPGQFWGRSDVDAVAISLTRAGIARASDLNRTARLHGHPSAIASGLTTQQVANIDLSSDQITVIPDPAAKLDYLEHKSGPSSSTDWLGELHDQYREHVHTPAVAAGRLDTTGALAGVALRILFAPLLQITATKRLTYGRLLAAACERALELAGWAGASVTVQWPNLLPVNELEGWQTALAAQQAGVSVATTLRAQGLDPDSEAEARQNEAAKAANSTLDPYAGTPGGPPA